VSYNISFWLSNLGDPPNFFSASFGGTTLTTITDSSAFDYTQFTYQVTATSATTDLDFSFYHDPSFYLLDDVSVQAIPEASTLVSFGGLLLAGGLGIRRARRKKA
jgi:hypothetical protein